jgi:hypothetical protein
MIPGLLRNVAIPDTPTGTYMSIAHSRYCCWSMTVTKGKISVEGSVRYTYDDRKIEGCNNWSTAYVSGYTADQIPSNSVQDVFEGLPSLLQSIMERYPNSDSMRSKIISFLRASKARI